MGRPLLPAAALALLSAALLGAAPQAIAADPPVRWQPATLSPRPASADPKLAPLFALCGTPDAALNEVAARAARRQIDGGSLHGADELAFYLRAAGGPQVWPRAWSVSGPALDDDDVLRRVKAWVTGWNTLGVRRCGAARTTGKDGGTVVTTVAVDALADLTSLPTTARVGQWVTLEGTMLVPATAAKVVLLGPHGPPRTVLASLSGGKVRSSFAVDQPGPWLIQVLATVSTGPRPVLEAMVFAGAPPPSAFIAEAAPGEAAAKGGRDDDDAMLRMMNAARATEQLAPLARDPELDKLARVHSEEMLKAHMVGHDVGGGDPAVRLKAAGIKAHVAGENVANAATLENAHRALWASPSHRGNLLLNQFTRCGVAVVRAPDGMVWVTQMFAG
ncbi:MAG: CAP domain-containing protein [Byssovorax sp.]